MKSGCDDLADGGQRARKFCFVRANSINIFN